ncbi:DM13 domain-containing protein, partial [Litorivicinus sp.]|nr:DM13 domain-containing protein [Litorivicinus sp.]
GEDFRSSPGPDYHVYVSSDPAIKDNPEFSDQQIEVSRLTKPNGAAFYLLETQNVDNVVSVLIWCKQFKEYIGSADLVAEN